MGIIKQKIPLLAPSKAAKKLAQELHSDFTEAGLSEEQIYSLCLKVVMIAKDSMHGEYTVMGGYSPEDQLLGKSRKLIHQLDEEEKLESLLEDSNSSIAGNKPSESDLEDAYNAADSIQFVGSEKQIKWAQDIATNSARDIALAKISFEQLPISAKWWIDNRNDISAALKALLTI